MIGRQGVNYDQTRQTTPAPERTFATADTASMRELSSFTVDEKQRRHLFAMQTHRSESTDGMVVIESESTVKCPNGKL